MSDRVQVLPGPGTVLRHGRVAVWAGPAASLALLSFLVQSARNVGESASSGSQIVDHIAEILSTRDPEPGAPFAVIGPSHDTWVVLLHGPVQLWDGTRWLAPTPHPGWLRSDVTPQPAVSVGPAGSPSPRLSPDSPYDLGAGTVPGGGLILVPDRQSSGPAAPSVPRAQPAAEAAPVGATAAQPLETRALDTRALETRALGTRPLAPLGGPTVAPAGARQWITLAAATAPPRPALLPGGAVTPAGRPDVPGVRCARNHFNHPAATTCAGCGRAITPGQTPIVGPRPVLGVLVAADDGATFPVDVDQVFGSDPTTDHGVAAGRLRPVVLHGAPGQLAPTHAELRLHEWTVTVIDRGSAVGTFVVPVGTTGWTRLTPYQPVALRPGSHLSIGQRVLTYLSPWPG